MELRLIQTIKCQSTGSFNPSISSHLIIWFAVLFLAVGKLKKRLSEYLNFRKETVVEPYVRPIADIIETEKELEASMQNWHLDEEFGRQVRGIENRQIWHVVKYKAGRLAKGPYKYFFPQCY